MKHSGKARKAAFKMILITLIVLVALLAAGVLGWLISTAIVAVWTFIAAVWFLFALFTLYFFRDPTPRVPAGHNLVVSPAHGKVDAIGTTTEAQFMGGDCQRISIFLSVMNVHVQNAPVGGKIAHVKHTEGQFLNAMKTESAVHNENVLIGFESSEPRGTKVGIRLIAGVLARRIVPWVETGNEVARGDRISLIQFGSRCDVYLPRSAQIKIKLGDRVVGGETVLAVLE
jgi:phosphatidylserine decarboxylase